MLKTLTDQLLNYIYDNLETGGEVQCTHLSCLQLSSFMNILASIGAGITKVVTFFTNIF